MADNNQSSHSVSDIVIETVVKEIAKLVIGPAGQIAVSALVSTGKTLTSIWLEKTSAEGKPSNSRISPDKTPPFSIVGLGRCGTHVTAHVARMVLDALSDGDKISENRGIIHRLFGGSNDSKLTIEPFMIVGDLDPTTLDEIQGLISLSKEGTSRPRGEETFERMLKIGYDPLSASGAGHLPIVAQFITRCLLALPPDNSPEGALWTKARKYLLDTSSVELNSTRLVFYIFSSGGGSGSGSAPELMRAQRLAGFVSGEPDPEMYYCGVSVIPYDQDKSKIHEINTGRFFVQYLADMNINLLDKDAYYRSTDYNYAIHAKSESNDAALRPWNGLAVISNQALRPTGTSLSRETVESNANQYIAQQVFNLASGQISVLKYERTGDLKLSRLNFQSVRMDPADLKNGLVGPFAVGFSVASAAQSPGTNWIDTLILKALASPSLNESVEPSSKVGFVQGLSISPKKIDSEQQRNYDQQLADLLIELSESDNPGLDHLKLQFLREVPLFKRCPKVIFVFTAPQSGEIPGNIDRRIAEVLSWIMPNLTQPRYAIVRGTTTVYTLSIFMQGSVVLCPEIRQSISSYLYLCWNTRSLDGDSFNKIWERLMYDDPPLSDDEILKEFGEYEQLTSEFDDYKGSVKNYEQNWAKTIGKQHSSSALDIEALRGIRLNDCRVNFREVAAALRYLKYIYNVEGRTAPINPEPR